MSLLPAQPCAVHPGSPPTETATNPDRCSKAPRLRSKCRRQRRALAEGVAALDDTDLVAILLGIGMAGQPAAAVASGLLERFGGVEGLSRLGPIALADQPGLGIAKALRLAASLELGRRSFERAARPHKPLRTPEAIASWFTSRIGRLKHEEMWVLALDGRHGLRGARRVAQGGLHGCSVTAGDILRVALADAASAMVLIHNHPSGDPTPSIQDLAMTRAVVAAAVIVGMPLIDHVIVTGSGAYVSLRDLGALAS